MTTKIEFLPDDHPLQRVTLKEELCRAQQNVLQRTFTRASDLCGLVFQERKLSLPIPDELKEISASQLLDEPWNALVARFDAWLRELGVEEQSVPMQASAIAERVQLIGAFENPDGVIANVTSRVTKVVDEFPKEASDIERGKNRGDVLDPYILAATEHLLFRGDFSKAIEAMVAHKALMKIEGLLGHLHEDVIGAMRGNVRIPEPRGVDRETLDPDRNPFPGADIAQPPMAIGECPRFHQLKSKTGSAKGGDGKRLGEQLGLLQSTYGAEVYYDALIGTTLEGHRSRTAVSDAAPGAIILVGSSAFQALTGSMVGPQLLLRVYVRAFQTVCRETGYDVETMAKGIAATLKTKAEAEGTDYLETMVRNVTVGPPTFQDSRQAPKKVQRRR